MTHGTSAQGESLSTRWADRGHDGADAGWRWPTAAPNWRIDWASAAQSGPMQLLALCAMAGVLLGLMITTAWQAVADAAPSGSVLLHLAALIAACAAAAMVAVRSHDRAPVPCDKAPSTELPCQLLAQMHHELRTPLNTMIGFSEVMLRELHGPLGNARYQEYAAHISESGGRLLKASEDALAVAATMSALVGDRRALRRERLPVAALLREAWTAQGAPSWGPQLSVADCADAEVDCDWQATSQALQHLLGEAQAHAALSGAVVARSEDGGGVRLIEIAVTPRGTVGDHPLAASVAGDGLRLMLARSLIEMQGATLTLCTEAEARAWTACLAFPSDVAQRLPRRARRLTAASRCQTPSECRPDSAAVPAAAPRASGQSPAAPQA